jgi:hypothetical protein
MDIPNVLIYRPISVMGMFIAMHTMLVGFGFLFVQHVRVTPLYKHLDGLVNADYFGAALIIIGLGSLVSYLFSKDRIVSAFSQVQSLMWLFIFFGYLIGNDVFVGLQNALFWAVLSGYAAFEFVNRSNWLDKRDQT